MRIDVHHHIVLDGEFRNVVGDIHKKLNFIMERTLAMATKEQLDKLRVDVAALITEAVTDITDAVAKAQAAPVEQADATIDQLDADVNAATQMLKDAAAKLKNPPAA